MILGLLSDTHDHLENIHKAVAIFRQHGVEQVLHAGDFCSPSAALALQERAAGVLGNNDGEVLGLSKAFATIQGRLEGDLLELELPEGRLALYHGTSKGILEALIASGLYRFVVHGHTHKYGARHSGATQVLNPGTAHGFGKEATAMILDSATGVVEQVRLG